ncbi:MAG: peptidase domain-containing ABC transporter [Prochlorococcaceae cyanobacterium]
MTHSPITNTALETLPCFQGLSPEGLKRLQADVTIARYAPGQPVCSEGIIPSQVVIPLEGSARLLVRDHGGLKTLARLGRGEPIGLASLLRAAPCEEVSAAEPLRAACLSDKAVLELLASEPSFRQWCGSTLFAAELQALIAQMVEQSPRADLSVVNLTRQLQPSARLLAAGEQPLSKAIGNGNGSAGMAVFAASANLIDYALGQRLAEGSPAPEARPPLPARLIALPAELVDSWQVVQSRGTESQGAGDSDAPLAGAPLSTGMELGQSSQDRQWRLIRGEGPLDETLACFQMLSAEMELPFRKDSIEKILRDSLRRGQQPDLQLCGNLAAMLGLHVSGAKVPAAMGTRLQVPALVPWQGGFALVRASNAAGLTLASPKAGWVQLSPEKIEESYPEGIELLLLDRTNATPENKFGPSWFIPALQRYRGILLQVLLASFVVQLFSLANPLLIQVIIDKVISQRSLDTLQVLGMALVVVTLLEGVISSLRTFLFTETTNRIDTRLGAEVIDHLLRLPLSYFDQRPVGELGTRIAELEKIRNFLTGQALTTLLDAAFSVIYIVVMALYSWVLTLIALAVLPIQVGLTLLGAPLFRRQYRQAAQENARTQSHLVEVLTGIQTVKAQNVEMVSRWKWQDLYSKYISRTFEKTITGTALTETSQVLQKLSQLLVLWVGAALVLKGELTLGQLIAFRIISGYVTQPLLRLSSIWQNIQELRVSFERLADVVDTPEESNEADKKKIPLPPIKGDVTFEDLNFAFKPNAPLVLKNVNLHVPSGTFVGIVGQSGSGKSTLMKLLPRLYAPSSGRIMIDHYDIDKVELYSLRRQIGIVPQDPLLFSGTVSENIALTDPDAGSDEIVRAATIACAHEFIMELNAGYSTDVGERGAGLSGGQKQRIAIARTLLSNPKLLVMDEATSALDYDTERRVCDNLHDNLHDCTVFFITHRLTTIRRADIIVMMHQGAIVEIGKHDELMALKGRYYALYRQQEAG